jgi:hypothetical protein
MKIWARFILGFALLVAILLALRFSSYEPVGYSVSNYDTQQFVDASRIQFFSTRFFTSDRPATIALAYKLLGPADGYAITNLSSPGDFLSPSLAVQPGYGALTTLQNLLSIAGWLALAFVLFRNLRHPLPRLLGPALVLLFGFSPQAAEWNYVLMSEPISISLFILFLALSIELSASWPVVSPWLWAGWGAILVLWVFARDTNTYFLPVLLAGLAAFWWLSRGQNRKLRARGFWLLAAGLLMLFVVQTRAAQASGRWINPFFNNMLGHVFPNPEYLAFFEERGLPATEEVLALRDSPFTQLKFFDIPYLLDWTRQHGSSTYVAFIASHPGWAWQTFAAGTALSFTENTQPFFTRDEEVTPTWLVYLGDLLHPKDVSALFVVSAELVLLAYLSARSREPRTRAITLCLAVFCAGEIAMLFVSILGDAAGTVRHTIGSLIPLRLSVWLLLVFIFDAALVRPSQVSRR